MKEKKINSLPGEPFSKSEFPDKLAEIKKFGHVMVDLETLGHASNSVICSIGAVEFDIETGCNGREFYVVVDIQSCLDIGLHVNGSTIEWWLKQNETPRMAIISDFRLAIGPALIEFHDFLNRLGGNSVQIWGNSNRFDLGILENAYTKLKIPIPWNFRLERDVRTLVSFAPEIKNNFPNLGIEHRPVDDCKYQIGYCSAIWEKLKKKILNIE